MYYSYITQFMGICVVWLYVRRRMLCRTVRLSCVVLKCFPRDIAPHLPRQIVVHLQEGEYHNNLFYESRVFVVVVLYPLGSGCL